MKQRDSKTLDHLSITSLVGIYCMVMLVVSGLAGCSQHGTVAHVTKVACVGNSITEGSGLPDPSRDSYPSRLQEILGQDWMVRNFGVGGTTLLRKGDSPYWRTKAFEEAKAFAPDVVVIMLGTNDTKPQNWKFHDEFVHDFEELIDEFASHSPHPKIFICKPVPAFPGDWGIQDSIIRNGILPLVEKIAAEKRVQVINLYSSFEGKAEYFPDKVHPNREGARLIAEDVYRSIVSVRVP